MKKQYAYLCTATLLGLTSLPAHSQVTVADQFATPTVISASTAVALATLPTTASESDVTLTPTQVVDMRGAKEARFQPKEKSKTKTVLIIVGVAVALSLLRILL